MPIQINVNTPTGQTIYATVAYVGNDTSITSPNFYWDIASPGFVDPTAASWSDFATFLVESPDGLYTGTVDPLQAGIYRVEAWAGGASSRGGDTFIGETVVYYDGTNDTSIYDLDNTNAAAILAAITGISSGSSGTGVADGFTQSDREVLLMMYNKIQRNSESGGPRGVA